MVGLVCETADIFDVFGSAENDETLDVFGRAAINDDNLDVFGSAANDDNLDVFGSAANDDNLDDFGRETDDIRDEFGRAENDGAKDVCGREERVPDARSTDLARRQVLSERKRVRGVSNEELTQHLQVLVAEKTVPRHHTRRNVGSAPRSLLLGLYTKRGLGIAKQTIRHAPLLAALHELASRRPEPHCRHGYAAIMINCNEALARHRDEYNHGLNYLYGLETDGVGGELWLALDPEEPPARIHPPQEYPIDCDWRVQLDPRRDLVTQELLTVCTAREAHLCAAEKEMPKSSRFASGSLGVIVPTCGRWQAFDGRRAHGVPPLSEGAKMQRDSPLLTSHHGDFNIQKDCGVAAEYSPSLEPRVPTAAAAPRPTGRGGMTKMAAVSMAASLRHGNAQCLDGLWVRALQGPPPTSFSSFFLDSISR
eukprot:6478262-Amphidinium_carterae.1